MADRAVGPYLNDGKDQPKRWDTINHDEDQTGDCRARDRGAGGCAPCRRSEEAQAYQAPYLDNATRNLWDSRNVDDALRSLWNIRNVDNARSLWDIRNSCWNCHRSVGGVVQLAVGRRDKRSPHLEQHQSSRALGRRNAGCGSWKNRAAHRGSGGRRAPRLFDENPADHVAVRRFCNGIESSADH